MDLIAVRLNTRDSSLVASSIPLLTTNVSAECENSTLVRVSNLQRNSYVLGQNIVLCAGNPSIDGTIVTAKEIAEHYQTQGTQTLKMITGHFALIVINLELKQVLSLTDKMGTHNIFYQISDDQIIVSTKLREIKLLTNDALNIDPQSIYQYIYFHCIPSPHTIYKGVYKLEPAQQIQIDGNTWKTETIWYPEFTNNGSTSVGTDSMQALQLALSEATQPYANNKKVGAFLSGGLDSSSVVAYLAKNSSETINTFTIGFSEPGYDEKAFAQAVVEKYKTNHTEYDVTPADIFEYLPEIAAYYDEPFGNSSALPTFFCAKVAKDHGIDIMLAGDGGDELFAGNARYASQKVFERYFKVPTLLRKPMDFLVPNVAKLIPFSLFKKASSYIYQANMGLPDRLQYYNFLNQSDPTEVFTSTFLSSIDKQLPLALLRKRYQEIDNIDAVDNMLYLDWKFTLADNDLMKVNYMTEFAGIAVIYPMLSEKMIQLSTELPPDVKLPGQQLRAFYKAALNDVLPDSTINKSKQGFGLPFGKWLIKDQALKELAERTLNQLKQRDIIQPAFIEKALEMQQTVHAHYYGELVWIMIMLELWLQTH